MILQIMLSFPASLLFSPDSNNPVDPVNPV